MSDEGAEPSRSWERWLTLATTFIAPVTFVTALLFYFGYVSSRAQYSYFGVDVDTLGMGTREFVMRSPQGILVPALLVILLAAATAGGMAVFRSGRVGRRATLATAATGGLLLVVGLVLVFAYSVIGGWAGYALLTPLVLATGAGLASLAGRPLGLPLAVVALLVVFIVVSTFWATATLAQWTGRGIARHTAQNLGDLPAVVLDTPERLYLRDGVTTEKTLAPTEGAEPEKGQTFRYRYYGLRLLVQAGDRMFLVPDRWTPSNSTLVFDLDDVRVKFRFVDQPP
ncbi:hypothetical protein GCM10023350_27120 [Nocardioides endophyticus]|uniref:DUF3592 domain-containing protein n=1 Tax=Nocardioides endophyticus TaxID=1353775 RepID=A0ABP8YYF9_9ACTN